LETQSRNAQVEIRKLESLVRSLRTEKTTLEDLLKQHELERDDAFSRYERAEQTIRSLKLDLREEVEGKNAEEKRAAEYLAEVRV
jgi:exonuclease VII small subunit